MSWSQLLLVLVVGFVAAAVVFFLAYGRENFWEMYAGSADRGPQEIASLKRSVSANDALACSEGMRADCDVVLPRYNEQPEVLIRRLSVNIERVDSLARRIDDKQDPTQRRYITYSPIFRFPDFVLISAVPLDGGQSGLLIYAGAQVGGQDYGANRARITRYLKGL